MSVIKVDPTGRMEVREPVDQWSIVEGLELSQEELSLEVLERMQAVKVNVRDTLMPALALDGKAFLINPANSPKFPKFTPTGAVKKEDVSIYPYGHAARHSQSLKNPNAVEGNSGY